MKILPWNDPRKIDLGLDAAFKAAVDNYAQEVRWVIQEERYWPGFEGFVTERENGQVVVGANRDIVDTGALLRSMDIIKTDNNKFTFKWEDPTGNTKPAAIHEGQVTINGTFIPGRPFATIAAENAAIASTYIKAFRRFF